jgi:hypothetical protein
MTEILPSSSAPLAATSSLPLPQDPLSPYYIHPNKNPSRVLVSPVIDGANSHGWARAMTMALQMNKFEFTDCTGSAYLNLWQHPISHVPK